MNILDRYVYRSLFLSSLICVGTIWGFYVIIDLSQNMNKFKDYVSSQKAAGEVNASFFTTILEHYLLLSPNLLYFLTPMITLMASMFTIIWMSRANELLLLKAAGISTYRVVRPFVIYALMMSLFMVVLQELIVVRYSGSLRGFGAIKVLRNEVVVNFQYKDVEGRVFFIGKFYPHQKLLQKLRITDPYENMRAREVIEANEATWVGENKDQVLQLKDGMIYRYDFSGALKSSTVIPPKGHSLKTSLKKETLATKDKKRVDFFSFWELWQKLQKEPGNERVEIALLSRITIPLSNLCLLFLGLPLMLSKNIKNVFFGIAICVILAAAFYGVNLGCLSMGKRAMLTPVMATWFPLVFFGSLGISLMSTIES